jgi:G:T-mismatch repair DNA endonuclease (very short patch repair protein)
MKDLKKEGWKVLRLWECEVENKPETVKKKLRRLLGSSRMGV